MNYGVIGGADGPTAVFIAGKTGANWMSFGGLLIVVLILLPNIVYAVKFRGTENHCKARWLNILEQVGRYASMFFMVFAVGIGEFGFSSVGAFLAYLFGNAALLLAYWIIWLFYFHKQTPGRSMALAIIPTCIFLLSGITLMHVLLIVSAVVFGIGHIYVTWVNAKQLASK